MALVECRVSNLTENVLNFKVHLLELSSCQVERLGHELVILATMVIMLLACKVEYARLMVRTLKV